MHARTSHGADTTAAEVLAGRDLSGLIVLVTGASSGLGFESARAFAAQGASVTLAARNAARTKAAARTISELTGNPRVDCLEVDLASLAKVGAAARHFAERHERLDVLVNNAAVMASPLLRSEDGHELQFAVCHLGHFLLTCLLVPQLRAASAARVVNVSSNGHKNSPVLFDDPDFRRRSYDKWIAYGQAKTANVLFSVELTRRLARIGITANAVHPGAIASTGLGRHLSPEDMQNLMAALGGSSAVRFKSVEAGAATIVWAAVAEELAGRGGLYLEDCSVGERNDDPAQFMIGYSSHAVDPAAAKRLWALSEDLVAEAFDWRHSS